MLEDICDGIQYCPSINRRDTHYNINYSIKQSQVEWKEELLSTRNMGKGLHKAFKDVVNDIFQDLPILSEPGSAVSYLIPEPGKFAYVNILSEYIKKPWLKATPKEIMNLINNQTFLVQEPEKGEPVTPFMDIYKAKKPI